MGPEEFSADGIMARLQRQQEAKLAEEKAKRNTDLAQQEELREAFENLQLPPDAMRRVMMRVERALEDGHKEALVYQFSSDFMKDNGRSLTSLYGDWTQQLTGAAARAYEFFQRELEPRGFLLRPRIIEYKDGIPGRRGIVPGLGRTATLSGKCARVYHALCMIRSPRHVTAAFGWKP